MTDLTSDEAGKASNVNASMVNARGIAGFQGWFWIANNATGKVSIVDGNGQMAAAATPRSDRARCSSATSATATSPRSTPRTAPSARS